MLYVPKKKPEHQLSPLLLAHENWKAKLNDIGQRDGSNCAGDLQRIRIAMSMSGGGFRAAIFHLGVLRRIAELGWLSDLDVVSTVSGGSVIGAFAVSRWPEVEKDGCDWPALEKHVVNPFLDLITTQNFIAKWAVRLLEVPFRKLSDETFTRTKLAGIMFNDLFYKGLHCSQLPLHPYLVINATSLVSIRSWRFTPHGLGDSRIGLADWRNRSITVGEAVAASAAFPPVFPPARIRRDHYEFSEPVYGEDPVPKYPIIALSDGGVYDNLGVEAIGKRSTLPGFGKSAAPAFLIVSDAGYPAQYDFRANGIPGLASAMLLYRVDDIAREQAAAQRRRALVKDFADPAATRKGLLVMLGSSIDRIPGTGTEVYSAAIGSQHRIPPHLLTRIKAIRTNLNRFNRIECEALMYHAYSMTDAFLWAHRNTCPKKYQVAELPAPNWKIDFTRERVRRWEEGLV